MNACRVTLVSFGLMMAAASVAGCQRSDAEALADEPQAATPERVRTVEARQVPDVRVVREVGRLLPWRRVTVSAEVGGRITRVALEAGDRVRGAKEGAASAVVVHIDEEQYAIGARRATAALEGARSRQRWALIQQKRTRDLFARGQALEIDRDRVDAEADGAQADLDAAAAALEEAELHVRRTSVLAPVGYRVAERLVEPGAVVGAGQPVLSLVDDRKLRLRFHVAVDDVAILAIGGEVGFEVRGLSGSFTGRVLRIGPEAEARSGRFPVEAEVQNEAGRLLAGMVAVARLEHVRSPQPLIAVPRAAIMERLQQKSVFIMTQEGTVERRTVRPHPSESLGPAWVAVHGVSAGERVAVDGLADLVDGQRVEPASAPAAADGDRG